MKRVIAITALMLACPVLADTPALPKKQTRLGYIKDAVISTLAYAAVGAGLGHAGPVGASLGGTIGTGLGLLRNADNFYGAIENPKQWTERVASGDYPPALYHDFGMQMHFETYMPLAYTKIAAVIAALGTFASGNWIFPCGMSALGLLDSFRHTWRQIQFYDQIRKYVAHTKAKKETA